MADFCPKWVRLAKNGTNLGLAKLKCTQKDLQKSQSVLFGVNLTHFCPNLSPLRVSLGMT